MSDNSLTKIFDMINQICDQIPQQNQIEYPQVEESKRTKAIEREVESLRKHYLLHLSKLSYNFQRFMRETQVFCSTVCLKLPTGKGLIPVWVESCPNRFVRQQIHAFYGDIVDVSVNYAKKILNDDQWNLEGLCGDQLEIFKGARHAAWRCLEFFNKLAAQFGKWQMFRRPVIEHFDYHLAKVLYDLLQYSRMLCSNAVYFPDESGLFAMDLGAILKNKIEQDFRRAGLKFGEVIRTRKIQVFRTFTMGPYNHVLVNASLDLPETFLPSEYGQQSSKNILRNLAAAAVRDLIANVVNAKWREFPETIPRDEVKRGQIESIFKEFYDSLQQMRTTYFLQADQKIWEPFVMDYNVGFPMKRQSQMEMEEEISDENKEFNTKVKNSIRKNSIQNR